MANVQPSNSSELQLYRVLQRANLLQYFETFITQGGDDVQQLCEAGEDEFLEIMALVGMASKPLHVRRLQKALQEWVANPAAFEVSKKFPTHVMSMAGSSSQSVSPPHSLETSNSLQDFKMTPPQSSAISTSTPWTAQSGGGGVSPSEESNLEHPSPAESPQGDFKDIMKDVLFNQNDPVYSGMNLTHPVLLEHQITAIAAAAAMLAQDLPPFEPKSLPKKQASKDITAVMLMSSDDPNRMDALRKYAAIYGRFDSKRKIDRPMSLHEISVNEAAAQLCSHFPALLTRREELFPLARQVVRDSGYQYSKGHSRAAEVLVLPKTEPGESTSMSTPPPGSPDEGFNELQNELTQVTMALTEMTKEQDRIKSALRVLLEANDHDQMKALCGEMDDLNDRHEHMTRRRQKIVVAIAKYRKGVPKRDALPTGPVLHPPAGKLPTQVVITSKPKTKQKNAKKQQQVEELPDGNPLNTLYMAALQNHKDSLFEEGLRIAKQYGMSDFAEEIIGMKSHDNGNETDDSGVNVTTSNGGSSAYAANSTFPSSLSSSAGTSSSAFSACGASGKSMQSSLFSSSPSPSTCASTGHSYSNNSSTPPVKQEKDQSNDNVQSAYTSSHAGSNGKAVDPSNRDTCNTPSSVSPDSLNPCIINDTSISVPHGESSSPQDNSTTAQGSTTTTTTITTKTGQVIEVETRRSSRRKNGDPDYFLINGGEKRFRGSNSRRSSSTFSERARRLSSSSSTSSLTPSTPTATSPSKCSNGETPNSGDIIRLNVNELRTRGGYEIQRVILDVNQRGTGPEEMEDPSEDYDYSDTDPDKRAMRKGARTHPYTGQRLLGSGDYGH